MLNEQFAEKVAEVIQSVADVFTPEQRRMAEVRVARRFQLTGRLDLGSHDRDAVILGLHGMRVLYADHDGTMVLQPIAKVTR